MKNIKKFILGLCAAGTIASCSLLEVDKIQDLNNPTIESVLENASLVQIGQLGRG